MGQILNIEIHSQGEVLANAYYHWSGYTGSALLLTKVIIESDLIEDTELDKVIKAVKLLELTGAGLPLEEFNLNPLFKLAGYRTAVDRNDGLIAISKQSIEMTRNWAEATVTIDIDTRIVDIKNIFYQVDEEALEPSDVVYESTLSYNNVTIDNFNEYIDEVNRICSFYGVIKSNDKLFKLIE